MSAQPPSTPPPSQPEGNKPESAAKEPYNAPLRPHVYDGIQEFDNRLPNWWLWTFYLAIIFSVLYWFSWYEADLPTSDAERVVADMGIVQAAQLSALSELSDEALWVMASNETYVSAGKAIYVANCQLCHLADLSGETNGGLGVDLSDGHWLWGNTPMSAYAVVSQGSPNTQSGMVSWLSQLGPQGVSEVIAYMLSHHTPESMAAATTENPPLGDELL